MHQSNVLLPADLANQIEDLAHLARARKAAVLRAAIQHALSTPEGIKAVLAAVGRPGRAA